LARSACSPPPQGDDNNHWRHVILSQESQIIHIFLTAACRLIRFQVFEIDQIEVDSFKKIFNSVKLQQFQALFEVLRKFEPAHS